MTSKNRLSEAILVFAPKKSVTCKPRLSPQTKMNGGAPFGRHSITAPPSRMANIQDRPAPCTPSRMRRAFALRTSSQDPVAHATAPAWKVRNCLTQDRASTFSMTETLSSGALRRSIEVTSARFVMARPPAGGLCRMPKSDTRLGGKARTAGLAPRHPSERRPAGERLMKRRMPWISSQLKPLLWASPGLKSL